MSAPQGALGSTAERRDLPMQVRLATVGSFDLEARTVELVWSTGAGVRRTDWWTGERYIEELSLDPAHVDLTRLSSGAPLLDSHGQWRLSDVIGVVERAWIEGGEARALVRFSAREEVAPILRDVQDGILRNVSVGYAVRTYEIIKTEGQLPTWRAVDWEPMEISLVPVGADAGAGTRAADGEPKPAVRTFPCQFHTRSVAATDDHQEPVMTQRTDEQAATHTPAAPEQPAPPSADQVRANATREERTRIAAIGHAVRLAGLTDDFAQRHIDAGTGIDAVRAAIFDELGARAERATPRPNGHIELVGDVAETRREAMTAAIMHRAGALRDLPDAAREWRGYNLTELARASLEAQGIATRGLARADIAMRAMLTTSDFSIVLGNAVGRTLRNAYEVAPRSFVRWARKGMLPDFRPATRGAVSAAALLEKVNEHGEFKTGYMTDAGETIQLATYAKMLRITRQTIINDDLDVFGRVPVAFAQGAAAMESSIVYGVLTGNPNMADGVALFHATHANLAGAGAAIGVTSVGAGRGAMRLQKEPSSKEPLNVQPRFMIVPAGKETEAQQFVSQAYLAAKQADYNPFAGSLELVVEPRLDAASATAWYLSADPAVIDTVEYAYLDGQEGLQVQTRDAFASGTDIAGIEILAWEDFAAKAIDFRGLYKNPGA